MNFVLLLMLTAKVFASKCLVPLAASVTIGNRAVVCVIVQFQNSTLVYPFKVQIDKLTTIQVTGLAQLISSHSSANISLQFQNDNQLASMMVYNSSLFLSLPLSSFIISTSTGIFQSIILDNPACSYCTQPQVCYLDVCYNKGTGIVGDMSLWVTWFGTDSNGQHYLSHNSRLSRLAEYSLSNIYTSAKTLIAV